MAQSTINSIGVLYEATYASSFVAPSKTMFTLATLNLPDPGIYIVYGGYQWSSHFVDRTLGRINVNNLQPATIVRSTGDSGGGYNGCCIFKKGDGEGIVELVAYQGSSSSQTAVNVALTAVKIA